MSGGDPSGVLRDVGTLFKHGMLGGLTDKQLLERFVNRNETGSLRGGGAAARMPRRDGREPPVPRAAAAADRLVRRGLAPAAAALWAEMAREASAAMPAAIIKHTARFVTSSPAAGAVPVAVTALAKGVIQMMWLARLKPLVAVAAALILTTAGVAVQGRQQPAPRERGNRPRPLLPRQPARRRRAVPDLAANRAIARQQLALIDEALATLHTWSEMPESGSPPVFLACGDAVGWKRFARREPGRPRSLRRWRNTSTT